MAKERSARGQRQMIGVDLRCLPADGSEGAGIAHATRELWNELVRLGPSFGIEFIGFALQGARVGPETEKQIYRLSRDSGKALRDGLAKRRVEGIFVPSGAVAMGVRVPVYPWVHDLAIFDHPEWFPQGMLKRAFTTRLFLRGLVKAAHIFAVSEATKRDILAKTHVPASRVTVTYQGSDMRVSVQGNPNRKDSYALIFGTIEPRKNIPFITDLWPDVRKRVGVSAKLVIAGRSGWGNVRMAEQADVVVTNDVSDRERTELMRDASMILIPSLHEGFGRVALEGMQLGVPVIVSDRGALPEVVGQGGLVLPLEDREGWVRTITALFQDQSLSRDMSQKGLERALAFSWKKTALSILAILAKK